tara:strand:- start:44 stop:223 length:180 start_codon:yes stop_codon:yes gene_type:complete
MEYMKRVERVGTLFEIETTWDTFTQFTHVQLIPSRGVCFNYKGQNPCALKNKKGSLRSI